MSQEGFKRMHAAILGANIVDYSRHEAGTIQLLTEYQEIIVQTIRGQGDPP